jgi:hypothetical protein
MPADGTLSDAKLVSQSFPKGIDLSGYSQAELN